MPQYPRTTKAFSHSVTLLGAALLALLCASCATTDGDANKHANGKSTLYLTSEMLLSNDPNIEIWGSPSLTENSPYGTAVFFDGVDDGIFFKKNPLEGLSSYTVEVLIRQDTGASLEPRFLHMGDIKHDRMMLETRLTEDGQWALDSYLRSGEEYLVPLDREMLHPAGEWAHVAVVVDKGKMTNYINGVRELEGEIEFNPIEPGGMSIGVRMNQVHWFRGAIHSIRVTPTVLKPDAFQR